MPSISPIAPRFTTASLLCFTAMVACSVFSIQNANTELVSILRWLVSLGLVFSLWLAFVDAPRVRFGYVGIAICLALSLAYSIGFPSPRQLYLCGDPLRFIEDGNYDRWPTILLISCGWNGIFGYFSGRIFAANKHYRLRLGKFWKLTIGISIATVGTWFVLVHAQSTLIATISQLFANVIFCVSIVGVVLHGSKNRIFWSTLALSIWLYLFFIQLGEWPYYFSPQPYLNAYYRSISRAEVTAHTSFAIMLSFSVAVLVNYVHLLFSTESRRSLDVGSEIKREIAG